MFGSRNALNREKNAFTHLVSQIPGYATACGRYYTSHALTNLLQIIAMMLQGGAYKSGPFHFVAYNVYTTHILKISTTYPQYLNH